MGSALYGKPRKTDILGDLKSSGRAGSGPATETFFGKKERGTGYKQPTNQGKRETFAAQPLRATKIVRKIGMNKKNTTVLLLYAERKVVIVNFK